MISSLCAKTCAYVFASHRMTLAPTVPAAIHLPSFETARQRTAPAAIFAICCPSSTCHTPTLPLPLLTRYSPSDEKASTFVKSLILMASCKHACPTVGQVAPSCLDSVRTSHCRFFHSQCSFALRCAGLHLYFPQSRLRSASLRPPLNFQSQPWLFSISSFARRSVECSSPR